MGSFGSDVRALCFFNEEMILGPGCLDHLLWSVVLSLLHLHSSG